MEGNVTRAATLSSSAPASTQARTTATSLATGWRDFFGGMPRAAREAKSGPFDAWLRGTVVADPAARDAATPHPSTS